MVSLIKYGGHQNKNDMNFVGKSTDTKPIKTFDGNADFKWQYVL